MRDIILFGFNSPKFQDSTIFLFVIQFSNNHMSYEVHTLKWRGFEEVGCKLTESRMRTNKPAMTDVTDSAHTFRSIKSRSQKIKHRHNNVDSTPA
jgi:hypothetical protein